MYTIQLKISDIDYIQTFHALYSYFQSHLEKVNSDSLLLRFYHRLGNQAEFLGEKMLESLPDCEKSEFLVFLLNTFSERLTEALNSHLPNIPQIGQLSISHICTKLDSDGNILIISQNLQCNGQPLGKAVGMQTFKEKAIVALIGTEKVRNLLLDYASQALNSFGVSMELKDFQLRLEIDPIPVETESVKLTQRQKEILIDALADFLQRNISLAQLPNGTT